jgi:multiple sugar transport system ATP-binding protein
MADVVLDGMTKIYENGFEAVSGLDLDVADGEFLVLVGPSGCGKTTALRMIAGLEDITKGELRIGGRRVNEVPSRDRDIAMVFQSYALYPHMSVRDNISFGLKLRRMPKAEIATRLDRAAAMLGLEELMDRRPALLSGGQRQRVAMGRAIVRNPAVFLMDEPLSNLDAKLRVQMRADIAALQRELAVTTVYVTHDQIEAMTMGDRVAVMRKGVLQQVADPQVLYDDPVNLFVGGFIGSPPMNMAEVEIVERDGGGLAVAFGEQLVTIDDETLAARPALRDYVGRRVAVGVRSEDLSQPGPRNEVPQDRRLRSVALLTEALGSEIVVHFDVAAPPVRTEHAKELEEDSGMADITTGVIETSGSKFVASFSPRSRVRPGDAIEVGVDTTRLYVFDLDSGLSIR